MRLGGYPAEIFWPNWILNEMLQDTLTAVTEAIDQRRGSDETGLKLGLKAGIPVAMGSFDAHLGGVGSGIGPVR